MSLFVLLKLVHVLAAITAVGANLTYPFWLRRAAGNQERVLDTIDAIGKLDARVVNLAYGVAFVTGAAMIVTGAYSFQTFWVAAAIVLFVLVTLLGIVVYAPLIRRLRAAAERDITSPEYAALDRRQTQLGLLALAIALAIVTLMVTKPTLG
jgi:uncharacterized membrane protein